MPAPFFLWQPHAGSPPDAWHSPAGVPADVLPARPCPSPPLMSFLPADVLPPPLMSFPPADVFRIFLLPVCGLPHGPPSCPCAASLTAPFLPVCHAEQWRMRGPQRAALRGLPAGCAAGPAPQRRQRRVLRGRPPGGPSRSPLRRSRCVAMCPGAALLRARVLPSLQWHGARMHVRALPGPLRGGEGHQSAW